jgi:hypothetical protein
MRKTERKSDKTGIYSVYWHFELEESGEGYIMEHIVLPSKEETPNRVKLAIIKGLLDDLKIPISIDEHMIPNEPGKW